MEDTRQRILDRVRAHYNYLYKQGYEVMFTALQGSQNYGLDIYTDDYCSDVDTKSIVLPTLDDFIYNKQPVSKVCFIAQDGTPGLPTDEHAEVKDIRVMFEMFRKANSSYIELLYSDYVIINPKYQEQVDRLLEMRDEIVNADRRRFMLAAMGTIFEKRKVLCHPYASAVNKIAEFGYDGKQLSHALRGVNFMRRFLSNIAIKDCFKVKPQDFAQYLIDVKTHKTSFSVEEAIALADKCCAEAKEMAEAVEDTKTGANAHVWDILNEIQAETMKMYILESIGGKNNEL